MFFEIEKKPAKSIGSAKATTRAAFSFIKGFIGIILTIKKKIFV